MAKAPPLLGFSAYGSGIGKTTLLTKLIPELVAQGIRVSVIKHAHHSFDIDHPGKDSYRLREAGAVQTLVASGERWALMTELKHLKDHVESEPVLAELVQQIDPALVDVVLVEGFKDAPISKIEVHRPSLNMPLLANHDANIIAIASDEIIETSLPLLDLNNISEIAAFIRQWLAKRS
ncbi:molybdopterin-guanine dinucleotide biosynthesis protein B [Methyloradius palustris]|uniref:Molybdopterin-guanine dinucleotide biosynthesis protein MobB n=1 Tax=Methyloradius palustris TaxID=2778876 RepID=A0A8D5GEF4_9PROT|nr:molybdopterin-guanine dinucleotide biosynthesis protein B [Methyloradius palustris]BCM25923.1 molybdopterin-guanine dinucleotide biosynthesis protein MobB [Methyloradius palustris]